MGDASEAKRGEAVGTRLSRNTIIACSSMLGKNTNVKGAQRSLYCLVPELERSTLKMVEMRLTCENALRRKQN